jgi:hypothetical protein
VQRHGGAEKVGFHVSCWIVIESPGRIAVTAHRPGDALMHRRLAAGWQIVKICRGTLDEALNLTAGAA